MKANKPRACRRTGRWTRLASIAAAATALAGLLSACQVNQVMWQACAPAADGNPFGADSTHVLVCRDGRWDPIMTIAEYLRIRQGERVTIGPLPSPPADNPPQDPGPQDPPQDPAPEPPPPPPPEVVEISAGALHTCARFDDGTAKCWGGNAYGELGSAGATIWTPRTVNLTGITKLAAGGNHTCAIRNDTTLWCWGRNVSGELGRLTNIGTNNPNPAPAPVMLGGNSLSGVVQVSAGSSSTCAVLNTGRIYCFGLNFFGQLGVNVNVGTFNPNPTPQLVGGILDATSVSVFADHACARRSATTVSCWGDNMFGQLGNGNTNGGWSPVGVNGLGVDGVSAGYLHTCAATWNARARCWGRNSTGQLGTAANAGTNNPTSSPVEVPNLTDVSDISAGFEHTCVRTTANRVKCWGNNSVGQLGRSTGLAAYSSSPALIDGLTGVASIAAGADHVCALNTTGVVSCWGLNGSGQLGRSANFNTMNANVAPVAVAGL